MPLNCRPGLGCSWLTNLQSRTSQIANCIFSSSQTCILFCLDMFCQRMSFSEITCDYLHWQARSWTWGPGASEHLRSRSWGEETEAGGRAGQPIRGQYGECWPMRGPGHWHWQERSVTSGWQCSLSLTQCQCCGGGGQGQQHGATATAPGKPAENSKLFHIPTLTMPTCNVNQSFSWWKGVGLKKTCGVAIDTWL